MADDPELELLRGILAERFGDFSLERRPDDRDGVLKFRIEVCLGDAGSVWYEDTCSKELIDEARTNPNVARFIRETAMLGVYHAAGT